MLKKVLRSLVQRHRHLFPAGRSCAWEKLDDKTKQLDALIAPAQIHIGCRLVLCLSVNMASEVELEPTILRV